MCVHRFARAATPGLILLCLLLPPSAAALIPPATTIDGPSADIVDLGGVAMAQDGTGGLVYRKRAGGRAHVFASRLVEGRWQPPQRIDVGQPFESSWPRIGAGDGGRLVVTWIQELGPGTDRLFSASLDPGATRFQGPVPIDLNVGEATASYPSLAMNRGGQAYLAYRVVDPPDPTLPPGYVGSDTRLARYNGLTWTLLGAPADRNSASPVRTPDAANSPEVGIDTAGNGIVAFQEPDDDFIDRIWARRVFATVAGLVLAVSPAEWGGRPLRGPADAFSLDVAGFGQGAVALRQQPGEGSALGGTRILVNTIPESFSEQARSFGGARIADGAGEAGPAAPGAPSVAVTPRGVFATAFGVGTASLAVTGDDASVGPAGRLDSGTSSIAGDPVLDLAPSGAGAAAWKVSLGGRGAVAARERRSDGDATVRMISAARGGAVGELQLAGSGLGDGAVAFIQGGGDLAQVGGGLIDAPPGDFAVFVPQGYTRKREVEIGWDPALSGVTRALYTVLVDDEPVAEGIRRERLTLGRRLLPDGQHTVQVIARDGAGQETRSAEGELSIDRRRPRAAIRRRGRRASVRVTDGAGAESSGLRRRETRISIGGRRARPGVSRFSAPARRGARVRVRARDRAGNRLILDLRLR